MSTIRLTAAQAMVRWLSNQLNEDGDPFIAGVWAIFGHDNVAGMGEALYSARDSLPSPPVACSAPSSSPGWRALRNRRSRPPAEQQAAQRDRNPPPTSRRRVCTSR